jgi:hypothetical protein
MTSSRFWAVTGALLLISGFVAANAHLVSVAIGSQTECVLDPSHKKGAANRAAKPSC